MAGKVEYKNRERIGIIVNKGEKDEIKAHAKSLGMSLNAYIVEAIQEKMNKPSE